MYPQLLSISWSRIWVPQLLHLIQFGFPLEVNRSKNLHSDKVNHVSVVNYPADVTAYIQEEISYDAILGHFQILPFQACVTHHS